MIRLGTFIGFSVLLNATGNYKSVHQGEQCQVLFNKEVETVERYYSQYNNNAVCQSYDYFGHNLLGLPHDFWQIQIINIPNSLISGTALTASFHRPTQ